MASQIGNQDKEIMELKKTLRILTLCFFVFSTFALFSTFVSPEAFWFIALIHLIIPVIPIINLVMAAVLFKRSKFFLFPSGVVILFLIIYFPSIFGAHMTRSGTENSLSVMSYNVKGFLRPRNYYYDRFWQGDTLLVKQHQLIDYVANDLADVKCLQEYYSDSNSVIFDTRGKIVQQNPYYASSTKLLRINRAKFGVAILSKYPIVRDGEVLFSRNAYNRGVYADILYDQDTIRIVNVHMQSTQVGISLTKKFFSKWKYDQIQRSRQADIIADFIHASPYPVILCGDLNATPFGYVYRKFKNVMINSFEDCGAGFGVTYNGKKLIFLRIDHQFHSPSIKVKTFVTKSDITFSDHYPIYGYYQN